MGNISNTVCPDFDQSAIAQGSRSYFAILHQFLGVIMLISRPLYQQTPVQIAQVVVKMRASPMILEFFQDQGSFCRMLAVRMLFKSL